MRDDLLSAFEGQARACEGLGSAFTAGLMRLLPGVIAEDSGLSRLMAGWSGDLGPSGASVPLRLAGGLHYLVLTGQAPGLSACYPPQTGAGLALPLSWALRDQDGFLTGWMSNAPQTNEVGRSAVLLAAAAAVARCSGLPLQVSELGASAGLNLNFARYSLEVEGVSVGAPGAALPLCPQWRGVPPLAGPVAVAEARGVDLNPLDPGADGLRLMSYVWPDQAARLERLRAALALAADHPPRVDRGDAAGWLEARLAQGWKGRCHLVCHTIAHQYFPGETQARIALAMEKAGAGATPDAPLAWVGMEADATPGSAAVSLRLWPGDRQVALGRAGFHGQWVEWLGL
ncbi:DUF2332 domain-containing protein [Paracoccaceae bacterium]